LPYKPLADGEIRILELLPGEGYEHLQARLHHTFLATAGYYEALSYTWGDPHITSILVVDEQTLNITENLADALRNLRSSISSRFIWADAVCIDQSNVVEKTHQVSIMNAIYRTAGEVLVWLGRESSFSDQGMEVIRYLTDLSIPAVAAPWYTISSETLAQGVEEVLMKRQWWHRIWTVQEAALARRVRLICGKAQAVWASNFDSLRRIKFRIKSSAISPQWRNTALQHSELQPLLETIESQLREIAADGQIRLKLDLLDVVYDFRRRKAADPRDQVYAILNLAEGRNADLQVRPDYTRTAEEAHDMLAQGLDRQYGGLGVEPGI
jgi:hypothetical protein